jgi:hypothetical protein
VYVWLNKNIIKNRTNRTNPNRIDLVWFGLVLFLKVNRTKPNRMLFSLAVRVIFIAKTAQTAPRTPLVSGI